MPVSAWQHCVLYFFCVQKGYFAAWFGIDIFIVVERCNIKGIWYFSWVLCQKVRTFANASVNRLLFTCEIIQRHASFAYWVILNLNLCFPLKLFARYKTFAAENGEFEGVGGFCVGCYYTLYKGIKDEKLIFDRSRNLNRFQIEYPASKSNTR